MTTFSWWEAPNGRRFWGQWCAVVRQNNGMMVPWDEVGNELAHLTFDDEFQARGVAAAHNGKFGFLRDRGAEKFLGPAHYFSLIHDYREPIE